MTSCEPKASTGEPKASLSDVHRLGSGQHPELVLGQGRIYLVVYDAKGAGVRLVAAGRKARHFCDDCEGFAGCLVRYPTRLLVQGYCSDVQPLNLINAACRDHHSASLQRRALIRSRLERVRFSRTMGQV